MPPNKTHSNKPVSKSGGSPKKKKNNKKNSSPMAEEEGKVGSGLEEEEEEKAEVEPDDGVAPMGLCRQMCVCAGLMASDGGLVFLQLAMVPCLQTLGVPVSLVTVAGVISGSLALMGLPVLGWISDGGANPHRRKKPAVVLSALVFVTGYSLVIAGCALRLREAERLVSSPGAADPTAGSTNWTIAGPHLSSAASTTGVGSPVEPYNESLARSVSYFLPRDSPSSSDTNTQNVDSPSSSQGSSRSGSSSESSPGNSSDSAGDSDSGDDWGSDPLGLGIPLTGLLGILGFVFMDMGNDFNNSCLKSFVLTCTPRRQHDSLFVVGVLMSAVGGCVAAVLGVLDIAALLVSGNDLEAVPIKTLLQSAFFLVFTLVCMMVTLLSAPPLSPPRTTTPTTPPPDVLIVEKPPQCGGEQGGGHPRHSADVTCPLHAASSPSLNGGPVLRVSEPDGHRTTCAEDWNGDCVHSPSSCGTPVSSETQEQLQEQEMEEKERHLSAPDDCKGPPSVTLSASGTEVEKEPFLKPCGEAWSAESVGSGVVEDVVDFRGSAQDKGQDPSTLQQAAENHDQRFGIFKCGRFSVKRSTLRMVPVCTSMFFMAGTWQSFNICATDYLGKVVYGGDPDTHPHSRHYAAYQQGITTGSLGVLMLNIAYVVVNLLQKKILALIGPKAEYLTVCVLVAAVLVSLQLTHEVMLFYTAAVMYGLFRCVMYTVPFMLANAICQQAALGGKESSPGGGGGRAKVGSTMALMTAMMPLSYVLVSTVTGPLIHVTGDPAAPLNYAITTVALAAVVFAFTK
ncbi:uncharacterized protein LOC143285791 [Babylonia areolata]|uniref:uncharacterized protein LOC143285791 n=1 Tax=Babylonia areolata TaxID=304850 RepID=UPI003FD359D8